MPRLFLPQGISTSCFLSPEYSYPDTLMAHSTSLSNNKIVLSLRGFFISVTQSRLFLPLASFYYAILTFHYSTFWNSYLFLIFSSPLLDYLFHKKKHICLVYEASRTLPGIVVTQEISAKWKEGKKGDGKSECKFDELDFIFLLTWKDFNIGNAYWDYYPRLSAGYLQNLWGTASLRTPYFQNMDFPS